MISSRLFRSKKGLNFIQKLKVCERKSLVLLVTKLKLLSVAVFQIKFKKLMNKQVNTET